MIHEHPDYLRAREAEARAFDDWRDAIEAQLREADIDRARDEWDRAARELHDVYVRLERRPVAS